MKMRCDDKGRHERKVPLCEPWDSDELVPIDDLLQRSYAELRIVSFGLVHEIWGERSGDCAGMLTVARCFAEIYSACKVPWLFEDLCWRQFSYFSLMRSTI